MFSKSKDNIIRDLTEYLSRPYNELNKKEIKYMEKVALVLNKPKYKNFYDAVKDNYLTYKDAKNDYKKIIMQNIEDFDRNKMMDSFDVFGKYKAKEYKEIEDIFSENFEKVDAYNKIEIENSLGYFQNARGMQEIKETLGLPYYFDFDKFLREYDDALNYNKLDNLKNKKFEINDVKDFIKDSNIDISISPKGKDLIKSLNKNGLSHLKSNGALSSYKFNKILNVKESNEWKIARFNKNNLGKRFKVYDDFMKDKDFDKSLTKKELVKSLKDIDKIYSSSVGISNVKLKDLKVPELEPLNLEHKKLHTKYAFEVLREDTFLNEWIDIEFFDRILEEDQNKINEPKLNKDPKFLSFTEKRINPYYIMRNPAIKTKDEEFIKCKLDKDVSDFTKAEFDMAEEIKREKYVKNYNNIREVFVPYFNELKTEKDKAVFILENNNTVKLNKDKLLITENVDINNDKLLDEAMKKLDESLSKYEGNADAEHLKKYTNIFAENQKLENCTKKFLGLNPNTNVFTEKIEMHKKGSYTKDSMYKEKEEEIKRKANIINEKSNNDYYDYEF